MSEPPALPPPHEPLDPRQLGYDPTLIRGVDGVLQLARQGVQWRLSIENNDRLGEAIEEAREAMAPGEEGQFRVWMRDLGPWGTVLAGVTRDGPSLIPQGWRPMRPGELGVTSPTLRIVRPDEVRLGLSRPFNLRVPSENLRSLSAAQLRARFAAARDEVLRVLAAPADPKALDEAAERARRLRDALQVQTERERRAAQDAALRDALEKARVADAERRERDRTYREFQERIEREQLRHQKEARDAAFERLLQHESDWTPPMEGSPESELLHDMAPTPEPEDDTSAGDDKGPTVIRIPLI